MAIFFRPTTRLTGCQGQGWLTSYQGSAALAVRCSRWLCCHNFHLPEK